MIDSHKLSGEDFSPDISIELRFHGESFNVARLGPHSLVLRNARPLSAGRGSIRLTVASQITIYHVDLTSGLDPASREQPYQLLATIDEAAA